MDRRDTTTVDNPRHQHWKPFSQMFNDVVQFCIREYDYESMDDVKVAIVVDEDCPCKWRGWVYENKLVITWTTKDKSGSGEESYGMSRFQWSELEEAFPNYDVRCCMSQRGVKIEVTLPKPDTTPCYVYFRSTMPTGSK